MNDSLCQFSEVRVSIPRDKIVRCYDKKYYLSDEETVFFREKRKEIEEALNRLNHAANIVDRILLKESSPERH